MEAWWSTLGLGMQIFYLIGFAATVALLFQFVLQLFGAMDVGDLADVDGDFGDGDAGGDHHHPSGLKFLSIQAITAFLFGLGWVGALALKWTGWILLGVAIGAVGGFILMFAVAWLLSFLAQFKEQGNLDYHNAIGETGTVYVPIPGERGGHGQIEITFQGRHQVLEAITSHASELKAHTKVLVVDLADGNTLVVRPL